MEDVTLAAARAEELLNFVVVRLKCGWIFVRFKLEEGLWE